MEAYDKIAEGVIYEKITVKLKGDEVVFLISTANGAETHALNVPVNTFEIIKKM